MLSISDLTVEVGGKPILKGINLDVAAGEVHAIMGPNGSGKSTLASVLAGREGYDVMRGSVTYGDHDLLALTPEERAREGVFLAFQYPVEIPGVTNVYLIKEAVDAIDFLKLVRQKLQLVEMKEEFLHRPVNHGFSGGEKKRNEIFQMAMIEPRLAILDETDSGLDIDALKVVASGVNAMRQGDRSILLVTHYQRLLDYIEPDYVHVLADGRFVKSGDKQLARELEEHGYGWLEEQADSGAGHSVA